MHHAIQQAADTVLSCTTRRVGGVPGVVAMATDCNGNNNEGASGKRELGKDQPMTIDIETIPHLPSMVTRGL
jgi:methyl acetate hydrolase